MTRSVRPFCRGGGLQLGSNNSSSSDRSDTLFEFTRRERQAQATAACSEEPREGVEGEFERQFHEAVILLPSPLAAIGSRTVATSPTRCRRFSHSSDSPRLATYGAKEVRAVSTP
ncbi:unnamed protein product [Lampetra planeri]